MRYFLTVYSPRAPVGHLPKRNRIDTFIDTGKAFPSVNVSKNGPGRRRFYASGSLFVARNFRSLHASTEAY
jgi:hypothetical protein